MRLFIPQVVQSNGGPWENSPPSVVTPDWTAHYCFPLPPYGRSCTYSTTILACSRPIKMIVYQSLFLLYFFISLLLAVMVVTNLVGWIQLNIISFEEVFVGNLKFWTKLNTGLQPLLSILKYQPWLSYLGLFYLYSLMVILPGASSRFNIA